MHVHIQLYYVSCTIALLSVETDGYVLLAANIDDFRQIAKKIVSDQVVEKIVEILRDHKSTNPKNTFLDTHDNYGREGDIGNEEVNVNRFEVKGKSNIITKHDDFNPDFGNIDLDKVTRNGKIIKTTKRYRLNITGNVGLPKLSIGRESKILSEYDNNYDGDIASDRDTINGNVNSKNTEQSKIKAEDHLLYDKFDLTGKKQSMNQYDDVASNQNKESGRGRIDRDKHNGATKENNYQPKDRDTSVYKNKNNDNPDEDRLNEDGYNNWDKNIRNKDKFENENVNKHLQNQNKDYRDEENDTDKPSYNVNKKRVRLHNKKDEEANEESKYETSHYKQGERHKSRFEDVKLKDSNERHESNNKREKYNDNIDSSLDKIRDLGRQRDKKYHKTETNRQTAKEKVTNGKKSRYGTMFPHKSRYSQATPNYYLKDPNVAEKYDFDEPIPEKDRAHENYNFKNKENDDARINGKIQTNY